MIRGLGSGVGAAPPKPGKALLSDVAEWSTFMRELHLARAARLPICSAELMCRALSIYLRSESEAREARNLYRLSLTMPDWERSPKRLRHCASRYAQRMADEDGCGAWLAVDVTKDGREHLYGLALTRLSPGELESQWMALSGACADGVKIRPVTGQKNGWSPDPKKQEQAKLRQNLGRVLLYALKTLPPRFEMTEAERVIASGCMDELWRQLGLSNDGVQSMSEPDNKNTHITGPSPDSAGSDGLRCCQQCGDRMNSAARRHAHWCSPSCRTLAYEIRRRLRQTLRESEQDSFEERAAIIEYEGRYSRSRAEQLAFDEVVSARSSSSSPEASTTQPTVSAA